MTDPTPSPPAQTTMDAETIAQLRQAPTSPQRVSILLRWLLSRLRPAEGSPTSGGMVGMMLGQLPRLLDAVLAELDDVDPATVDEFLVQLAAGALIARSDDAPDVTVASVAGTLSVS